MTNREIWLKEFKRIQRLTSGISKKLDIEFILPKQPKKVEKRSIERLKKITPAVIKDLIPAEEAETSKAATPIIDLTKPRKGKAPEEPKKGYRVQTITAEERSRRAKKAAQTRKQRGIKPFAGMTQQQRSQAAKKAAQTRKQKGIKPFADLTPEQRSAAAKKAAETRKQRGINPFANLTPEQRKERARKAAETRRQNKLKRLKDEQTVQEVQEDTGEITEHGIGENEVPSFNDYQAVIENFLQQLYEYEMAHPKSQYGAEIELRLRQFEDLAGQKALALALMNMANDGIKITVPVIYNIDSEGDAYIGYIISYLNGSGVFDTDEALDVYNSANFENEGYFDYDLGYEEEQEYLNKTYVWTDT